MKCTEDNRYLIILFSDYSSGTVKYYLKIWDRETKQYKKIDGKEIISSIEDTDGFTVGKRKNLIAISQKDGVIKIINIKRAKK